MPIGGLCSASKRALGGGGDEGKGVFHIDPMGPFLARRSAASNLREHAGQDLQPQILLIAQPVGSSLQNPNLVVQSFHEAQRHLVVKLTVGCDSVPVANNHQSEVFVRSEPLPLQSGSPVLHESSRLTFFLVVPQLMERFLQHVGRVEPLVGFEQPLQRPAAVERQVLAVGQQRVLLPLDELAALAGKAGILALAHLVQRIAQMAHDMEFIEEDLRLRRVPDRRDPERLPHIHHGQLNPPALFGPQPLVELIHALFGTVPTPKPDRALMDQVADDNAVAVSLADEDLINSYDSRIRRPDPARLLLHVLLVELLDRFPVQMQFPGNISNGRSPATATDEESESLGVERIVGQPRQFFLFHLAATRAPHAPHLDLQVKARVPAGKVAHEAQFVVVEGTVGCAAHSATRFFPRRESRTTRALGSPKMPRTVERGRKPGKRYVSWSLRSGRIHKSCHVFSGRKDAKNHVSQAFHQIQNLVN